MFKLILLLSLILLSAVSTTAQAGDCGNGFAQRLTVGAAGRVIPEPPPCDALSHQGNSS